MSKIVGYKTVSEKMNSWHDNTYQYQVGKTFIVKGPKGASCGVGLHFAPTPEGAINYANGSAFRMLLVESDTKYLLGKDSSKFRVSQLKVVKELKKDTTAFDAAVKEFDRLSAVFLNPPTQPSTQKLVGLANKYFKAENLKNSTLYVINNSFEALYWSNDLDPYEFPSSSYEEGNDAKIDSTLDKLKLKSTWLEKEGSQEYPFSFYAKQIAGDYLLSRHGFSYLENKSGAAHEALFEMLMLGCLPLGYSNKKLFVFVPTENIFKMKNPLK